MSIWTHVCGLFRINCIRTKNGENSPESKLGKMVTFDDLMKNIKGTPIETNIPRGSEGSLEYRIIETENIEFLNGYQIAIYGDLRDFEKDRIDEILEYLDEVFGGSKEYWVRQGIVNIKSDDYDSELNQTYIWDVKLKCLRIICEEII